MVLWTRPHSKESKRNSKATSGNRVFLRGPCQGVIRKTIGATKSFLYGSLPREHLRARSWKFSTVRSRSQETAGLRLTTRDFFQLNLYGHNPYILSDEKMGLSVINMLDLSSNVRIAHIASSWNFILLHYTQVLWQYRLCRADHAYLTLQRQPSHLNGRKLDHRQL
jgi:hypothetical protein